MKKPKIDLTHDQLSAREAILEFWKKKEALLTLGGYAGTGKTTMIAETVRALEAKERPSIAFCAFTGRAAMVLRTKLERAEALAVGDYCGTIHSLIYKPKVLKGIIVGWEKIAEIPYDLVVIDEASMVNEILFRDLASYGKPILAVGDHGQLPPVEGSFSLMADPKIRLEKIHRQAEDNPIIKLSIRARQGQQIEDGPYGEFVMKTPDRNILDKIKDVSDLLLLCGINSTRVSLNSYMRRRRGVADGIIQSNIPLPGEKLICLKNNHQKGIYNGMTGTLEDISEEGRHWYSAIIRMENGNGGEPISDKIFKHQFGSRYTLREWPDLKPKHIGELFDWGYAMTVHKAQGGEARRVVLFEERMPKMSDEDWARWLYTGITRSSERLIIVGK